MTLRELYGMLYGKPDGCYRIAATLIDLSNARECRDVVVGIVIDTVVADFAWLDGAEGSSGSHSPLAVAIWAYLARVLPLNTICALRRWRFEPLMCGW